MQERSEGTLVNQVQRWKHNKRGNPLFLYMIKSSVFYRIITLFNFIFALYIDFHFLRLPITLFVFSLLILITLLAIFLFFEAITFKLQVLSNKIIISSCFYEKTFNLDELVDFNISFLRGKIKLKDEVVDLPPLGRGSKRKVEELLQK